MNKKNDEFIHTVMTDLYFGLLAVLPSYFTMLIETVWHSNYFEL